MKKTSLAIALSLILTACGSSGGKPSISIPTATQTPTINNSSSNKPATHEAAPSKQTQGTTSNQSTPVTTMPKPDETKLNNTGVSLNKNDFIKGEINKEPVLDQNGKEIAQLSGHNRAYSFNGALMKSKDSGLGKIIVGNTVLKLADKVGAIGGLTGSSLSKAIVSLYNATQNPERDIFYFGSETPESSIPKSGIVTYKGNASRYDNVTAQVKNIGETELIADFENKKIKGELKIDGLFRRNISLKEADIQGNGFKGEAVAGENHILMTRKGEYEGKFYGPRAEEVAGKATFSEELKDLNTSFSAEQVK
ncbi:ABC transporter substrate-binding protein [Haemophilus parahaemolyticus]|uniref:ABC transporter substrate-binding protein n=2 Tax=Haemophilus parahaemolyticus TaxID=735 RepID=A0AAE6JUF1_HAEPH|nr:Slam-dependent surface lipoprotein [Haemophilus parahaemolyticus]EIJ72981.1 transferrin-binding protein-like solute-binding domain protein [Haemophilus parahaemolyticus HK385]OOR97406.1 ABC transporter substrate-binding protein [Haemophilus parahaemolyticus]QEN11578.1 ABC transporter substrate-binding protein [Haemophilus parahaemolyticus]QRP12780.1 transferrin-binding protein-like solute binding protein [Haemophilus parahaemolyticus]STO66402.1 transferrin binding protein [Haemophilus parah